MAEKADFTKIKEEVKQLIAEIAEIDPSEIKEDSAFVEDLGIDSMMALEIVASLEKKYKVTVNEEEIPNIRSLKDIYSILEKKLK